MAYEARDEIRARVDLVDMIGAHVRLQKAGNTFKGLCPFHQEKTPSFTVRPEQGMWHCFGCGEHGDCFGFLMKIESLTFPEALQRLADKTGIVLTERPKGPSAGEKEEMQQALSASTRYYRDCLSKDKQAREYLTKRQLDDETIEKYGIGLAPEGWEGLSTFLAREKVDLEAAAKAGLIGKRSNGTFYDRFRNRIMFPVWDHTDRIVGYGGRDLGTEGPKYLNSPETPLFHKGSILYGLNLARKAIGSAGHAVLVEGFMDVISAHRGGVETAVASMGTAFGESHTALLKRFTEKAICCFDSDSAGNKAALAACGTLETAGFDVRVAQLPAGEDPDSLVSSGRAADLIRAVEAAIPGAEHRLDTVIAGYNLTDEADRSRMLAKAAEALAAIPNDFERDRLILKLVAYHANFGKDSGFDGGRDSAEARIREAVNRLRDGSSQKKDAQGNLRGQGVLVQQPAKGAGARSAPRSKIGAVAKAEMVIIHSLLITDEHAETIAARMSPDQFVSEKARLLAEEIWTRRALGEDASGIALDKDGDQQMAQLASSIIVREDIPPLSAAVIDDCIARVVQENTRRELARLRGMVEQGELAPGHADYQRYLDLDRFLHS